MTEFLIQERHGPIVVATLNDPDRHNAFTTPDQIGEIEAFCREVSTDVSIRAVVLTGAGKSFCAGGNVKDMGERSGIFEGNPFRLRNRYREGIQQIPLSLYELEVPVVAAVNGAAIGAGLDLACMCDVRIASDRAIFAESFVKLGIVPGDGGAWLLPRTIGLPRATLMTLTGDRIDAEKALEWGLVAEVVPHDELMTAAMDVAARIAANSAPALRLTKRLLREGQDMKLQPLLELSAAYQALAHHTDEHAEAVSAFLEKRQPRFEGR